MNKKARKRILCILLQLMMLVLLGNSALAAESPIHETDGEAKEVTENGYTFMITEAEDENHQLIRNYKIERPMSRSGVDLDEIRALLIAMGVEETTAYDLPADKLQYIATSESIQTTTSYVKIDEDNNRIYADEETALREAAIINARDDERLANLTQGIMPTEDWEDGDQWMRLHYTVVHNWGYNYGFMIGSKWLTMPITRSWDTLGACASHVTAVAGSGWGEWFYDVSILQNGKVVSTKREKEEVTDISIASVEQWGGMGITFWLPFDIQEQYSAMYFRNFNATLWFQGNVSQYEQATFFNTRGSYDHSKFALMVKPSASLSVDGGKASMGLAPTITKQSWFIDFTIHYVP